MIGLFSLGIIFRIFIIRNFIIRYLMRLCTEVSYHYALRLITYQASTR